MDFFTFLNDFSHTTPHSCIQGTTAFVVDKHDIIGIDLRHGQQIFKVPALGLAEDECIWNIHVSGPLTSICTVFRNLEAESGGHPKVMWVSSKS